MTLAGFVDKLCMDLGSFPVACAHALHSTFTSLYIQTFLNITHTLLEFWVIIKLVFDLFD
jgi:hypothetical protein